MFMLFASSLYLYLNYVLAYCFFFVYCYVDPRDLHSFPTRRSSDLINVGSNAVTARAIADASSALRAAILKDRKSTRLNSSHTVISYAVFCLKKKRISEQRSFTLDS